MSFFSRYKLIVFLSFDLELPRKAGFRSITSCVYLLAPFYFLNNSFTDHTLTKNTWKIQYFKYSTDHRTYFENKTVELVFQIL